MSTPPRYLAEKVARNGTVVATAIFIDEAAARDYAINHLTDSAHSARIWREELIDIINRKGTP